LRYLPAGATPAPAGFFTPTTAMTNQPARYLALDVFRGMTVCLMIIVNSPGSWGYVYGPFLHAPWHGLTPTDLVFPSFLFAVGNAMAFAMHKYTGQGSAAFWAKTLKRTCLIFLIGYLLSWFPFYDFDQGAFISPADARIPGVLQRIALCYGIASIIIYYTSRRTAVIIGAALLLAYWLILYVAGAPGDPYSLEGYAGNALDKALIGGPRLYHGEGVAFDPEGILSTIAAIVNVIIGFLAGDFIRRRGNTYEVVAKLLLAGTALIALALAWHQVFPINKKIWTSSFTLVTTGIALVVLSALIYLIELQAKRSWTYFFEVFGKNPLFIYASAGVLITVLYTVRVGEGSLLHAIYSFFATFTPEKLASLLFALSFMLLNWSIGYVMDRNKIYIRV
jgi:predicted acyltransferase